MDDFFKIDIVVKSNGIFKSCEEIYEVSSNVSGKVEKSNVKNSQFVEEGEVLFVVDVESLGDTIEVCKNKLAEINERIEILKAYSKSVDDEGILPESLKENRYYQEFIDRKKLLISNININNQDIQGRKDIYQKNLNSINGLVQQYNSKVLKLRQVEECVLSRQNKFDENDAYYNSIVSSYISKYNLMENQYDSQLDSFRKQEEDVEKAEALEKEKEQALSDMELQEISSIEQQIESIDNTILSLSTNQISAQLELENLETSDNSNEKQIKILTEKSNIAAELLTYQNKAEECMNQLNSYDIKNNNCSITANTTGYFYLNQDIKKGSYIQEGMNIGKIYPKEDANYYAEVYIENSDIVKVKAGQDVKFDISAYPSNEYGYLAGKVENISKDITIDETAGSAYYLVRVNCDNTIVKDKNGDAGELMNGMACQAKIVTDEENVLTYLLKKIDLID